MKKACILLEDGFYQEGLPLGAQGQTSGEVVFNTSMSGYQEILSDPSYCGQIVCMTYPLIGNYGINDQDFESSKIQVEGFIVKENSKIFSNWQAKKSLDAYLKENNIVGIEGVDTRAIARHLRDKGSMKGIISTKEFNLEKLTEKLDELPSIVGKDVVKEVTSQDSYEWKEPAFDAGMAQNNNLRVVVIDCGVKFSILRNLKTYFKEVIVTPAKTSLDDILKLNPQGVLFSNGPGDPQAVSYVIDTASILINRLKNQEVKLGVMGICLGHQILGLAFGGEAQKLKFGHHGGNHPVKDLATGKIDITAQNHNFIVPPESIPEKALIQSHINLYDNTTEGSIHKDLPVFSVQFHPEAGPGPFDSQYIFGKFRKIVEAASDKEKDQRCLKDKI